MSYKIFNIIATLMKSILLILITSVIICSCSKEHEAEPVADTVVIKKPPIKDNPPIIPPVTPYIGGN